jgi:hypothetical protein
MNEAISRRDFLKGALACGAQVMPGLRKWERETTGRLFSNDAPSATENINADRVKEIKAFCEEYGTPYNPHVFEAGERIIFKGKKPYLSLITKDEVTIPELTIKFTDADFSINTTKKKVYDINGAKEIDLGDCFLWNMPPILKYKLIYKTPEGKREETCYRYVKTPFNSLKNGPVKIIALSDSHFPDDRSFEKEDLSNPAIWDMRNNGEYVNRLLLSKLVNNPDFQPSGDLGYLMNGFNMARAMWHIINHENPDFIINLGDDHGGFGHTWEDLGLPNQHHATPAQKDAIIRMFRLAQRKIYSAIMAHIPWYYALGNHDGENGWGGTLEYAMKWRKQYLPLPGLMHGGSPDENYYPIIWGGLNNSFETKPEVLCAVVDNPRYSFYPRKPEEWTAGEEQIKWLDETLKKDAAFRLVFLHRIFGGWPTESSCRIDGGHDYAYGRGMGFTGEYYDEMNKLLEENGGAHLKVNPSRIEQVYHTKILKERGVNAEVYGHDHIFKGKKIGTCDDGRELHAVCAGSTKHVAETDWFREPLFKWDYGDYERRDFFTCPGYLLIEISAGGTRFDYKCASPPYLNRGTNMPEGTRVGDTVNSYLI